METKRPVAVTIAAILLIVLGLLVAGFGIARQYGLLGIGFSSGQFMQGQVRNRDFNPQGGFPQGGFPQGGFPNDQNTQGMPPNFTPNQLPGVGIARIFRLIRPVTIVFNALVLVLAIVAAIGLFKSRRWAATLAIVLSVLMLLGSFPGLLRIFSPVMLIENVVRMILAVAVVVLLLLPSARKSYLPGKETL